MITPYSKNKLKTSVHLSTYYIYPDLSSPLLLHW